MFFSASPQPPISSSTPASSSPTSGSGSPSASSSGSVSVTNASSSSVAVRDPRSWLIESSSILSRLHSHHQHDVDDQFHDSLCDSKFLSQLTLLQLDRTRNDTRVRVNQKVGIPFGSAFQLSAVNDPHAHLRMSTVSRFPLMASSLTEQFKTIVDEGQVHLQYVEDGPSELLVKDDGSAPFSSSASSASSSSASPYLNVPHVEVYHQWSAHSLMLGRRSLVLSTLRLVNPPLIDRRVSSDAPLVAPKWFDWVGSSIHSVSSAIWPASDDSHSRGPSSSSSSSSSSLSWSDIWKNPIFMGSDLHFRFRDEGISLRYLGFRTLFHTTPHSLLAFNFRSSDLWRNDFYHVNALISLTQQIVPPLAPPPALEKYLRNALATCGVAFEIRSPFASARRAYRLSDPSSLAIVSNAALAVGVELNPIRDVTLTSELTIAPNRSTVSQSLYWQIAKNAMGIFLSSAVNLNRTTIAGPSVLSLSIGLTV